MSGSNHCTCIPLLEIHIVVTSSSFQTKRFFLFRGLLHPIRTAQALPLLSPYHIHDYSSVSLFVLGVSVTSGMSPITPLCPEHPAGDGWRCLRGRGNNRPMLHEHNAGPDLPPSMGKSHGCSHQENLKAIFCHHPMGLSLW